ncbi:hypothetical protein A3H26_03010 [candidate division WWE3 bacterium RIFCSPLOWO2_12_FULL_36_10]|uniref:Uncharacterized protein n=1 Tax=candidate division WWE3 bacterium RIFCSPLOWO2_12_FULL_36_10 TaxID=1802630 RepID=A0A1F4VJ42_UNCKA|nr:MAG: hypothetical protein A3H26_03010 [candidate division WWE3 bacterium RIFCSPLOWO2_12_FULL_36_10]
MEEKNGVKTFVVTLAISMVVFGALYYLISDFSKEVNIESSSISANVKNEKKDSPFESLTAQKFDDNAPAVLGTTTDTTTETTEGTSSVPVTGSNDIIVFALSTLAILCATYLALMGPKKLVLPNFEKNATKN